MDSTQTMLSEFKCTGYMPKAFVGFSGRILGQLFYLESFWECTRIVAWLCGFGFGRFTISNILKSAFVSGDILDKNIKPSV